MTVLRIATWRAIGAVGLVLASAACAARVAPRDAIVTDRPDFTESVESVPSGWTQVEAGYTAARAGGVTGHTSGEGLVRVGLGDRSELRVGLGSYSVVGDGPARAAGLEDASLGAKVVLTRADEARAWLPASALIVATSLPTGARAFRSTAAVPEAKLGLGWDLSERASFTANLNAALPEGDAGRYAELAASGSLGLAVGARAGLYAEAFSFFPRAEGLAASHYVNGGATWQLNPHFQLDARAGRGVGGTTGEWFVGLGLARRF